MVHGRMLGVQRDVCRGMVRRVNGVLRDGGRSDDVLSVYWLWETSVASCHSHVSFLVQKC